MSFARNLSIAILVCSLYVWTPQARAVLVSGQLTNTSEINPDGLPVLGAVNNRFSNQPAGLPGTVNGVDFDDALWGAPTVLSTGAAFLGTQPNSSRTANTASTISGPDELVLENIANSINFLAGGQNALLTFSGLVPNTPVQVQLIASDEGSGVSNWAGVFSLAVIDTVTLGSTPVGSFQAGTDPNNFDAQLATFDAITDASGFLQVQVTQTASGQHAGIGGIAVFDATPFIPEPSSGTIMLLGLAGWLGLRRRRRA